MIAECLAYYRERGEDPGYQGPFEQRYCDDFARFQGGGYADAVATGTVAVYVALAALGLSRGAEVICSPITDPGTLSAIILNGLVPRLADSSPSSFNMGVEEFRARITPEVKGVVIVHSLGRPAEIEAIVACAAVHGIRVVEDCSQAHGARVDGRPVGTFGDIAAFSTMYRKAHITGASEGWCSAATRVFITGRLPTPIAASHAGSKALMTGTLPASCFRPSICIRMSCPAQSV